MQKFSFQIDGLEAKGCYVGSGKPLIFLHGWGGNKESWEELMNCLAGLGASAGHCLIALDFPGFGESEEPKTAWSVGDYLKWFQRVLKCLEKGEGPKDIDFSKGYDLAVHSFGGRVLFKMAGEKAEFEPKADKLIIIAAAGIKPKKTLPIRLAGTIAKTGKRVLNVTPLRWLAPASKKALYKVLRSHDYEKTSGVMRETFLKVINEDLKDNILGMKNPALIFWGKKDRYVPLSDARTIHVRIPGSKLMVFPDGKHGIHRTKAKEIAEMVNEFIK
ncbi:alpha/beta hydrolase [Candidatus Peregrinibacteria bacterium]|nr:alpha/beta hydrolase [Candidatus Peregrinibacteria bacterium]